MLVSSNGAGAWNFIITAKPGCIKTVKMLIGQAAQRIPLFLREYVAQVFPSGCAGDEFNREPQVHRSVE